MQLLTALLVQIRCIACSSSRVPVVAQAATLREPLRMQPGLAAGGLFPLLCAALDRSRREVVLEAVATPFTARLMRDQE